MNASGLCRKGENGKYYICEACPPLVMGGIAVVSKLSSYETSFSDKYCNITSAKPISQRTNVAGSVDAGKRNDKMRTAFRFGYDLDKYRTFIERPDEEKYKLSTCESVEVINDVVTSLGSFDNGTRDSLASRLYALPLNKTKRRGQRSEQRAAINSDDNTFKRLDLYQSSPDVAKQKNCCFRQEPLWKYSGKVRPNKPQVFYQHRRPSKYQFSREISARGTNILLGNYLRRKGRVPRTFGVPNYNGGDVDSIETETSLSRLGTRGSVARCNTPVSNQLSDETSERSWKTEDGSAYEWREQVVKLEKEESTSLVVKTGDHNGSVPSHCKVKTNKNRYYTIEQTGSISEKPKISERKASNKTPRSLQLPDKSRSGDFEDTDISVARVKENAMQTEVLLGTHSLKESEKENIKSGPAMVKRNSTVMFGPDVYEGFEHRKISRLRAATANGTQSRTPSLISNFNRAHFEGYSKKNFPFLNVKVGELE